LLTAGIGWVRINPLIEYYGRYVSSALYPLLRHIEEQFGERDYWQPPEQFEENKMGDCEDLALCLGDNFFTRSFLLDSSWEPQADRGRDMLG
jgi:hypothetical protein